MTTETTPPLNEDEKSRLVDGYKIMGDNNWDDIVRVCFQGNASILPRLQKHVEENKEEFQGYLANQTTDFDTMMVRLQEFEKSNGHQHVKEGQDRALFWWVNYQKYLLDRLKLPEDRENKLLKIKFDFRDDAAWETNLHGWDTKRTT